MVGGALVESVVNPPPPHDGPGPCDDQGQNEPCPLDRTSQYKSGAGLLFSFSQCHGSAQCVSPPPRTSEVRSKWMGPLGRGRAWRKHGCLAMLPFA